MPLRGQGRHLRLRADRPVRAARRPRPVGGQLRPAAPLADPPRATTSRSSATSPTSTTRSWSSRAEQGRPWYNLAYDMTRQLTAAYDALNVLPPTYEPLATGHVPEMLALIERLIERGHAYPAADGSGDVYFDVRSWPSYGEVSGQRVDEMNPAEDADPRGKRDPRDFALWKGRKAEEPETASWPSPWGPGRPGWHIECSAMALKYLGDSLRHPRRRRRPALPAPRERAGPVAGRRLRLRRDVDAQRLDHHRRREDEQVARQQPDDPGGAGADPGDRPAVLHRGSAHYRSHVEFSVRGARRGRGRVPADRALPDPRRRACSARSRSGRCARLRDRDGRRPRRAGRGRGDLRGGPRGQQAARPAATVGRAARCGRRRSAGCSR